MASVSKVGRSRVATLSSFSESGESWPGRLTGMVTGVRVCQSQPVPAAP
ncbi:MAG: hypothetical protein WKG07_12845 [Hymenobacter sp.]